MVTSRQRCWLVDMPAHGQLLIVLYHDLSNLGNEDFLPRGLPVGCFGKYEVYIFNQLLLVRVAEGVMLES